MNNVEKVLTKAYNQYCGNYPLADEDLDPLYMVGFPDEMTADHESLQEYERMYQAMMYQVLLDELKKLLPDEDQRIMEDHPKECLEVIDRLIA